MRKYILVAYIYCKVAWSLKSDQQKKTQTKNIRGDTNNVAR